MSRIALLLSIQRQVVQSYSGTPQWLSSYHVAADLRLRSTAALLIGRGV